MHPTLASEELILRLLLSVLLGGLIGFERERLNWVAGLRTHMIVCLGATLVMYVSQYGFHDLTSKEPTSLDPSRMAAQVVSGIGFLGAGTILFLKNVIRGLTTAASLWAVAAVGLAIGGGEYLASITATMLILLILAGIKPIEKRFIKKNLSTGIRFSMKKGFVPLSTLYEILSNLNVGLGTSRLQMEKSEDKETYLFIFQAISQQNLIGVLEELRQLKGIEDIEISRDLEVP